MIDQPTPDRSIQYRPTTTQPARQDAETPVEDDVVAEHHRTFNEGLNDYSRRMRAAQGDFGESDKASEADDESINGPTFDGLRHFVHAGVDTALDVAESLVKFAGALLGTITSPSGEPGSSREDAFSATEPRRGMPNLALLEMNPGAPGSAVTGRMEVVNSTREYMDAISPKCDVLVGTGGKSIPGHCVSFVPRITDVKPNDGQQFIITIQIPESARRGSYSGLITVTGHPAVRLLVHLDVN